MLEAPLAELKREIEKLLGWPLGSFDPPGDIMKDLGRINRVLATTFTSSMGPEALLKRIRDAKD